MKDAVDSNQPGKLETCEITSQLAGRRNLQLTSQLVLKWKTSLWKYRKATRLNGVKNDPPPSLQIFGLVWLWSLTSWPPKVDRFVHPSL